MLLYGLIFASVLLLVEGLFRLVADRSAGKDRRHINARLRLLDQGLDGQEALRRLLRKGGEGGAKRLRLDWALDWAWALARIDRSLSLAGLRLTMSQMLAAMAGSAALVPLVLTLVGMPPLLALTVGPLVGGAAPLLVVTVLARRRLRRFSQQLPGAIDTLVRSLRAGHPVAAAIGLVGREMPDPIGTEFGITYDEMTYGLDLREALANLSRRIPLADVRFLVVAVRIQAGIGGNLAEVLASLAQVMRERERLMAKVKALSAEGRLSALILSLLPFVVVAALRVLNPTYYGEFEKEPLLRTLLAIGGGGIVLGIGLMVRMVRFRV
jgi:tight adherence protein B